MEVLGLDLGRTHTRTYAKHRMRNAPKDLTRGPLSTASSVRFKGRRDGTSAALMPALPWQPPATRGRKERARRRSAPADLRAAAAAPTTCIVLTIRRVLDHSGPFWIIMDRGMTGG